MKRTTWGFEVSDRDTSVRPQDDFFRHVNGGWISKNPIPATESRWGTFMKLRYGVDLQLQAILTDLLSLKRAKAGSAEQLIRDFYKSGMDMKRRDALDATPLAPYRAKVQKTKSLDELIRVIASFSRFGSEMPWSTYIDQDDKDSTRYALRIVQGGLGMPERDYYLGKDKESVRVRTAYQAYAEKLFRMMGYTASVASKKTEMLLRLETALAKASMKKEDRRDPHKTYHKVTRGGLKKLLPEVNWDMYLKDIGAAGVTTLIVSQPEFLQAVSKLMRTEELSVWQNYIEWHLVNDCAGALSSRFVRHSFSFYGTVLSGTKALRPLWRRTLNVVNGRVGELLGRLYVARHFPPAAKKKMEAMVADLFVAYEARIKALPWMSAGTKKKALQKLHALTKKIGYPDKWKSYTGLVVSPTDYFGNLLRSAEYEHKRQVRKLKSPVDRKEWFMYPQTVNAYFAPNLNDIVFPAGILQPPFFSLEADDAVNYGSIGAVIGHEITHGFDDEGSKFDANGNLKSWWTKEDRAQFEKRAEVLRKQFDQYTVADGVKVNGKLTLGENIADLGGAAIALDAYLLRAAKTAKPLLDGYTPIQRFFLGFAVFECGHATPEYEKMAALTDPHSPEQFRINGPASNLPAFYEAFGVKKGDKLYRDPKNRAEIW